MLRFRWALGLVPLAVLFFAALTVEIGKVESDVAARVEAVAKGARAKVSVNGRDVSLTAAGLDASAAERLTAAVLALPGVRQVAALEIASASSPVEAPRAPEPVVAPAPPISEAPSLPFARPFTFSVERNAAGLVASGFAPGAVDRDAFMAALRTAAAPRAASGSLELANGLPASVEFQTAAQFIAVQASRLVAGRASVSDDRFSISGETPDSAALAALRAAVGGVLPGGLKLAGIDVQALPPPSPPPLSPYVFSAERAGNAIVLAGAVPSPETRALLLDLAGHGGREVVDRTTIASGEPVGFATFAAHGLSQVARMLSGRFALTDASYALEGEAADFDAYDAIRLDLRTAPQGVSLARIDVQAPLLQPYAFSVAREGGAVVLRGAFPDESTREAVLAMARKLFPGLAIRNEARIARGAPQGFAEIARAALGALSRMASGSVSLAAGALSLNGAAAGAASDLAAALQGLLPAGVSLDLAALQPSPPAVASATAQAIAGAPSSPGATMSCAPDQRGIVAEARIHFDSARGRPQPQFESEIVRVARLMMTCGGATALVSGHTDGAGDRAPNLELSGVRAGAVARMLREAGVPAQRIATLAFAWDRPAISPEASADDRARNRRVDIVVRQGSR